MGSRVPPTQLPWKGLTPLPLGDLRVPPSLARAEAEGMEMNIWSPKNTCPLLPSHFLSGSTSQMFEAPPGPRWGRRRGWGWGEADDGEAESGTHIPNKITSRAERIGSSWIRVCRLRCLRSSRGPAPPSPVLWNLGESAGSGPPDSPSAGRRGRAPEVEEERERKKFEKQATRGEPDKPGPGRAEPGLGPRSGGGRALGGRGAAEASAATDPK